MSEKNNMKKITIHLIIIATVGFAPLRAQEKNSIEILQSEFIEHIISSVDQRIKDSLNSNIQFNVHFQEECEKWLKAKIATDQPGGRIGVAPNNSPTKPMGTAHMYSRIISNDGFHLDLILQGIDHNIERMKSGQWDYHVGTNGSGIPDNYFAMAVEKDGISYFVYCFD